MNTVQHKLDILSHYWAGGSIATTAAHFGISRQSVYTWDRLYRERGEAGLQDGSRAHTSRTLHTPDQTVAEIRRLAVLNPTLGGTHIARLIVPPFKPVTAQTVNALLRELHLSGADDRLNEIERQLRPTPMAGWFRGETEAEKFLFSRNARYRDHDMPGARPGEALALGVVKLGAINGVGAVFLSCVVDIHTCIAFAELGSPRATIAPTLVLARALDFFGERGYQTEHIKLHNTPFKTEGQQRELISFIGSRNIFIGDLENMKTTRQLERRLLSMPSYKGDTSGFIVQFERDVMMGLFDTLDQRRSHKRANLKRKLERRLDRYNRDFKVTGYPLYGQTPLEALEQAKAAVAFSDHDPSNSTT